MGIFGRKRDQGQLSPQDVQMLSLFKGSTFGPGSKVTLPSGRTISGDEMSVLIAALPDHPQTPEYVNTSAPADETTHERAIRLERTERSEEKAARERRYARLDKQKAAIMQFLRPADVNDYVMWLEGYLRNGGSFTHYYDYDFRVGRMYVATADVTIPALYGAMSVDVIVPKKFTVVASGHCGLYFMEGFQKDAFTVPSFNNLPRYLHELGDKS